MEPEFPPNSEASKRVQAEKENLEQITKGQVIRKKKPLRKKFSEVFIAGSARTAVGYAIWDVLLPAAKDTVVEVITQGVERLFFGESRRRGSIPPQSGPAGYVNYQRMSGPYGARRMTSPQRVLSRQARARHDFDEIVLESRTDAEEVIDRLFELVSRYESATVADLYELVGLASGHTDHRWGWTDLRGAGVSRTRDGYLLDLPEPVPLG